jgi:cation transporter-like permease
VILSTLFITVILNGDLFVKGLITSLVIVLSKMCNVNPDNVATPIAGALGDITALVILSFAATLFYNILGIFQKI